jgi:hypothetical protein
MNSAMMGAIKDSAMPTAMGVRTMPQKGEGHAAGHTGAHGVIHNRRPRRHTPGCAHCHTTTPIPALIRLRHSSAA